MESLYLLLVLSAISAFVTCQEESCQGATRPCIQNLADSIKEKGVNLDCETLKKTERCLEDFGRRCLNNNFANTAFQAQMDRLNQTYNKLCNRLNNKDSAKQPEGLKCLDNGKAVGAIFLECHNKITENLPLMTYPFDINGRVCSTLYGINQCVAEKIGDLCGDKYRQKFYYRLMLSIEKNSPEAAQSPLCAKAIEEVKRGSNDRFRRRRRSVEDIAISNMADTLSILNRF